MSANAASTRSSQGKSPRGWLLQVEALLAEDEVHGIREAAARTRRVETAGGEALPQVVAVLGGDAVAGQPGAGEFGRGLRREAAGGRGTQRHLVERGRRTQVARCGVAVAAPDQRQEIARLQFQQRFQRRDFPGGVAGRAAGAGVGPQCLGARARLFDRTRHAWTRGCGDGRAL